MKDTASLIASCQQQKAAGKTNEEIVAFLRAQGCSKVESMTIVARIFGLGLNEAKEIVHLSPTWSDIRTQDDRFHQTLEKGLQQPKEGGRETS